MKDRVYSGAFSGIISSFIVGVLSYVLKNLNLYDYTYIDIAASLVYPYKYYGTLNWVLLGWLNNTIIGIILGIILVYILSFTGKDYGLLKGAIFGLIWWFILTIIVQPQIFEWGRFTDIQSLLANIIRDVLFGFLASYFLIKYADLKNPV